MLPIKLKMQAFASYAEAAEIDFEKLDSLFLIHGETGAGKTAVLDGMMYALYGESSGGERTEMRCALPSAEKLPTEVEFTFKIRGTVYKFTRSIIITPRSKKLEQRQDCFYLDAESGQFRAFFENPKQATVRQKAEELTGLTAEQFRQVIILPQGRFERLLTSESADKEKILSTLFCAEKYTALSDRLTEKAAEERRLLSEEDTALKTILAGENAESPQQLEEEIKLLSEEKKGIAPMLENAKKALAEARSKVTAAELLGAKFSALGTARSRLERLDAQKDRYELMKELLSAHGNANRANAEYAALSAAKEERDSRGEQLLAAKQKLADTEKEYTAAQRKNEEIAASELDFQAKSKRLAVLSELSGVYEKAAALEEQTAKLAAEYAEAQGERKKLAAELESADTAIAETVAERERITRDFSRRLPELSARKSALEQGAEAAARLEKYTAALKGIHRDIGAISAETAALEQKKAALEAEYDRLYGGYIASAAAELSSSLKEGQPCPVCGSLSHPAPACASGTGITAEDVKTARSLFENAAAEYSEKQTELAKQQALIPAAEDCIAQQKRITEECGYTAEKLKHAVSEYAEAEKQHGLLPRLDRLYGEYTAKKQSLEGRIKAADSRISELEAVKSRAEAELEAHRARIDKEFPDAKSYAAGTARLRSEIDDFSRKKALTEQAYRSAEARRIEALSLANQAQEEYSAAEKRLKKAEADFAEKLSSLGISGVVEYKNALLSDEKAAAFTAETESYAMERHAAEEQKKSLEAELEGVSAPDAEGARAAAAAAETEYSALTKRETVVSEKVKRLTAVFEEYSARRTAYVKAREKNDKRTAFAKFMHGDKGISFTRYVLGIMLRLVAAEANRILADIHGGTFRLCVKSDLAANSKQGLDLEVENTAAASSVKYGVRGLSGGEKFLISLALSLGLSSVAQSRSGGIEIEAMFIDEGFGSLDPSSLREAIGILCGISSGRNTIGIISHVEELKNVIPCGIHVTKSADGRSRIKEMRA
ncbi:MAG: AAA family ATPase [Oscillospiraceae bacterium]|nr:AAA family ATPase [Oscillospiraceae bacterium]